MVLRAGLPYIRRVKEQARIESEFDTPEEAAAYDKWLREKVAASLADRRPAIPHDEVMAELRAIIAAKGRSPKK